MIVYFVRHASAGKSLSNAAQDARRPLDKDGQQQATDMGRFLAALNIKVDAVISSPLTRAEQTAAVVSKELGYKDGIEFDEALTKGSDFDGFRALIDKHHKQDAIMVVGHNPGLSRFVSLMLSREGNSDCIDLKKGAVASADVNRRGEAVLNWCVTPKVVQGLQTTAGKSSRPKASRK